MSQASSGRSDKQQQEQTSPNHIQRLFLSSVIASDFATSLRAYCDTISSCHVICDMCIRVFQRARANCNVPLLISCKTPFRKRFYCRCSPPAWPLPASARRASSPVRNGVKVFPVFVCLRPRPPSDANNMSSCRRWKSSYLMHNITGKGREGADVPRRYWRSKSATQHLP